jgi:uncharacterized membrane protein
MSECSWCKGKGFVKKPLSLTRLTLLEWALVLGLIAIVLGFIALFGKSHGTIGLFLVLGLFIGIPVLQLVLWVVGFLGLITREVKCAHCEEQV